jgi:hypothetical protein
MSRHGMVPPGGGFPIRQPQPNGFAGKTRLIADVLLREAAVGLILCTGAAQEAKMRLAFHLAAMSVTFLWTRRFGLMRPMIPKVALMESMLLYLGGVCFSNLMRAGFGLAPWWSPIT